MNQDFYQSFPMKRMGAGCLFFNTEGRVLLLRVNYKDAWEIPGGIVELNESPKAACEREVLEELGLKKKIGKLLVVNYNSYPDDPQKTEALMFVFDGGVLASEEIQQIRIQEEEILKFDFFQPDQLPQKISSPLQRRIFAAIKQRDGGNYTYLENQKRP